MSHIVAQGDTRLAAIKEEAMEELRRILRGREALQIKGRRARRHGGGRPVNSAATAPAQLEIVNWPRRVPADVL